MKVIQLLGGAMLAATLALPFQSVHALTLTPPTLEYGANPGDVIDGALRLYNETDDTLTVYPIVFSFTFKEGDELTGTPQLYDVAEEGNGRGLGPWMKLNPAPIVLDPKEYGSVPFTISVPKNAEPGGYYGAVQLSDAPKGKIDQKNLGVISGAAALVFLRVNGEINEDLTLTDFSVKKKWLTHLPADFTYRLENNGTIHQRPSGNIFIKNMLGLQSGSPRINPANRSVLPDSARIFGERWQHAEVLEDANELVKQWKNFGFGRYTATLQMNYGSKNQILTRTVTFWVIPWLVILLSIVLLIAVIGLVKAYNRSVIRRFQKMQQEQKEK